jgi:hypothetical protein
VAGKRCIDVDLAWISGTQHLRAEATIERALAAKGWAYAVSSGPTRYCRDDWRDFDQALAEARQVVGEQIARGWDESDGGSVEAQREAHRIVGQWLVTPVTDT